MTLNRYIAMVDDGGPFVLDQDTGQIACLLTDFSTELLAEALNEGRETADSYLWDTAVLLGIDVDNAHYL